MRFCRCTGWGRLAASMSILLALSACYEEEEQTLPSAEAPQGPAAKAVPWLEIGDGRAPGAFLAAETGLPADRLAPLLDDLSARYWESPRMIANRVLQLAQEYPDTPLDRMMADLGAAQDGVARDGRAQDGAAQSLGPVVQQYRVLRAQGASHADAVAALMGPEE